MKRTKRNYFNSLYIAWAVLVSISCMSCSTSAPTDKVIRQDWELYCGTVLRGSLKCLDMTIIDKSIEGDDCEVFIAAKAIKTINGRPEKEMLEVKYKLFYIKFDSGWTAISVDSLNNT
jgi:hypothetical protein